MTLAAAGPGRAAGAAALTGRVAARKLSRAYVLQRGASRAGAPGRGGRARRSQPPTAAPTHPAKRKRVLLVLLLALGLLYGVVRATYPVGLARILQVNELFGSSAAPQAFLARSAFTWLNLALVGLFSLSLALLLTALHTDLSSLPLLQRVLKVPESAIVVRVSLYTGLIISFIVGKYLLVELLSYIFDLRLLVNIHYREFLRTTLLLGLLLPVVSLLYLGLNGRWPGMVGVANACVLLILTATVLRVARTLHQRGASI
ncbi:MAG: DUF4271 domain-containing protein [Hymenobacter sp.]